MVPLEGELLPIGVVRENRFVSLTAVASGGVISGLGDLPSPLDHPELVFKADVLLRLWEGEMLHTEWEGPLQATAGRNSVGTGYREQVH